MTEDIPIPRPHKPIEPALDRRSVLRTVAAAGLGAGLGLLAAPAVIRAAALASSGELTMLGWSGYRFDELFAAFTRSTGITVRLVDQPDQESIYAAAKAALKTGGIDMVEPSLDRVPAWISEGLVQSWDAAKIALDRYEPAFVTGAAGEAGQRDGRRYFLPSVWGTEAITQSVEAGRKATPRATSLAELFDPDIPAKVTVRAHSGLAALGRVLERQGRLPKPFIEIYRSPETMRAVMDVVLAEAIRRKARIAQFWSSENEVQAAFRAEGCTLGLTWDSTAFALGRDGLPFTFVAPEEGAFAWLQGYMLHAKAVHVEQALAFAEFVSGPEGSALNATAFSANPTGRGGIDRMDAIVRTFYKTAYPGEALARLWWWPPQDAWFLKMRDDYAARWKAA